MKLGLVWLRILWRSLVWFGWGFTNEAWFGLAEDSLLNLRILRCRFEVCFGGGFSGVDSKYGLVWLTILRVWRWSTGRIILKIFLLQGINTKPDQKGGGVASKPVFVLSFTYNWECYHIFFIRVKYKKGWEPPLILYEDIFFKAKFEIFH